MYKVISTSPTFGKYSSKPLDMIKEEGYSLELVPGKGGALSEESKKLLPEVDAIIVGVEKLGKEELDKATNCKIITKHGVGVDNIDVEHATKCGIIVTNVPAANSDAVADNAMGLILALSRGIVQSDKNVRNKIWKPYVGMELAGKTLGIIGTGQIGKKVCQRAKRGFNMDIVAFDLYPDNEWAETMGVKYVKLEQLLKAADVVTVHVPFVPGTGYIIGEKELSLMKESALLINTARGGLIDQKALAKAISENAIKGAAIDVFEQEPPWGSELIEMDQLVLTSHISGYTTEALEETGVVCAKNIIAVLEGKKPQYIINPEVL